MNSPGITIRHAVPEDADYISQLLNKLAAKYLKEDITEEGEQTLRNIFAPEPIVDKIKGDTHVYFVAEIDSNIAGISAVKDNSHLYHLFVAEEYHGRGLATLLWNKAKTHCISVGNPDQITVFSSSYAVEFYKKLGFEPAGNAVWEDGLRSTPMVWQKK